MSILSYAIKALAPDEHADFDGITEELNRYLKDFGQGYQQALEENRKLMDRVYEGFDIAACNALTEEMYDIWIYLDALRGYFVAHGQAHAMLVFLGKAEGAPDLKQAEAEFAHYCGRAYVQQLRLTAEAHKAAVERRLADEEKVNQFRAYCTRQEAIDRSVREIYMLGGYELQRARWPGDDREDTLPEAMRRYRLEEK